MYPKYMYCIYAHTFICIIYIHTHTYLYIHIYIPTYDIHNMYMDEWVRHIDMHYIYILYVYTRTYFYIHT